MGDIKTMRTVYNVNTYYQIDGRFYTAAKRKDLRMGDIFIDGRDYNAKVIEKPSDLISTAFMAPELYLILEEATIHGGTFKL